MEDENKEESKTIKRRDSIGQLIHSSNIKSLDDIKKALDLTCNTSTISRDLDALLISKTKANGKFYELPATDEKVIQAKVLKNLIEKSMDKTREIYGETHMIAVRTKRGYSSVFAREIINSFQGKVISALPLEESVIVFTNDLALKTGIIEAMSSVIKVDE